MYALRFLLGLLILIEFKNLAIYNININRLFYVIQHTSYKSCIWELLLDKVIDFLDIEEDKPQEVYDHNR